MILLYEGCKNENVIALKARLNELGYDCGEGDVFDRKTAWAVRWFRRQNELAQNSDTIDDCLWARIHSEKAAPGVTTPFQYYSMKDPLWADYPYDAANTPEIELMSNSACGPTSMAMAVSTALRRAVLPPVLADWSNAHGFRDPDGINGTDDSFFPACAELYGLTARLMDVVDEHSFTRIAEERAAGNAVISNVVPGSPFTKCGHYNLISRIEDGRVHICDAVPKNMELPDYTVSEWLDGQWARCCIIVGKKV